MRPTRLELSGFASFRDHTVVDFDDADLFVLTGPTGAGKSSIIDAITFALYGAIPRYENRNLVAPLITQGMLEAKVRLDFTVAGESYTAVRVVRRSATGASTREARLERGDRVLAGNADELTAEVTKLLGLSFEHFQKCVVLPQGDFARFLHDRPKDRQDLLVRLLDVEIYREMGRQANSRAKIAEQQARDCETRLETEFAHATRENLDLLSDRAAKLEDLVARIEADVPLLEEIVRKAAAAEQRAATMRQACQLLEALRTPDGIDQLAEHLAEAEAAASAAETELHAAAEEADRCAAVLESLPARAALEALLREYRELERLQVDFERAQAAAAKATGAEERVAAAHDEAGRALQAAVERRESILHDNYAFRVAQRLRKGDRCLVCGEILAADPSLDPPPGLKEADAEREAAQSRLAEAEGLLERAHRDAVRASAQVEALERQLTALEQRLDGQPAPSEVSELLEKVGVAGTSAQQARTRQQRALQAQQAARGRLEQLKDSLDRAWSGFDRARDSVATLEPPEIPRRDLTAAWATLVGWARKELPERQQAVRDAEEELRSLEDERNAVLDEQRRRCEELDIAITGAAPRDAARDALQKVRISIEHLEQQMETAQQLRAELKRHEERAAVAQELARHLRTDRFENWYLGRAFRRLVWRASDLLEELSNGQYALDLTESNEFQVIDHTNAGERRFIRTLSGGETFLASLALALALADNLADMAANGAARLEAIFLDEGFGTLDPDTLDTVAGALEELGSGGRMVGVVTHVRDLAERLPVRFEVRKDGRSSKVEKVLI